MNDLPAWMAWFGTTGFIDAVIAFTLIEVALLWAWSRWRGGWDFMALLPSLASGLMLMLALRGAVLGAGVVAIVLPIALSGCAHVWDLRRRWCRSTSRQRSDPTRPEAPAGGHGPTHRVAPINPP